MTVGANVKSCFATLKGAQATLSTLAQNIADEQEKQIFHTCMLEIDDILMEIKDRITLLEREEPQY